MLKVHLKALALLSLLITLFYWKVLLTKQFSLLTSFEAANQAYTWSSFIARSLKAGQWPVWDPFTFSGRSFVGETQTGVFYPLNLLLGLAPLNDMGMISPSLYHYCYAIAHIAAAYLMFCLCRVMGLRFQPALLSGLCFSLGGFMSKLGAWPHLLHSALWLPLLLLLAVKAITAANRVAAAAYAATGGLVLGLTVLAGGIHLVFMHSIVLISASAALAICGGEGASRRRLARGITVVVLVLLVGLASSAIQILPSIEYSAVANRFLGNGVLPASEKIPYHLLDQGLFASAILSLAFAAPATDLAFGEFMNPYLGVLPLLLALIAVCEGWRLFWVRYLACLAVAAFAYSLGSFSLLHGVSYALVPKLWIAREAGRFVYLMDFALAILAGFGLDCLLSSIRESAAAAWRKRLRALSLISLAAMALPVVYGQPSVGPWTSLSLLFVVSSCGVVLFLLGGQGGKLACVMVFGLVMIDLHAFEWSALNKVRERSQNVDQLERLLSFQGAAGFLRAQQGLFRVAVEAELAPNVGDAFGLPMTLGTGVTMLSNYDRIRNNLDLFNVRYLVRPASYGEGGAVYQDAFWKVYERPTAYPRAWLVHKVAVEPSADRAAQLAGSADTDLRKVALSSRPLAVGLNQDEDVERTTGSLPAESVTIDRYERALIEARVRAAGGALLVFSEVFFPGWKATVNGVEAEVHEVDHALRGVVVPNGESRVVLKYQPAWFAVGIALAALAWAGTVSLWLACWITSGRGPRTRLALNRATVSTGESSITSQLFNLTH
jgi:hypothetical protein